MNCCSICIIMNGYILRCWIRRTDICTGITARESGTGSKMYAQPRRRKSQRKEAGEMRELTLHPMKEIRVVVAGEHRGFVTDLFDKMNASGYTVIGNVSGKGHHGVREAHFMFSEQESLVMIMTVVPEEK